MRVTSIELRTSKSTEQWRQAPYEDAAHLDTAETRKIQEFVTLVRLATEQAKRGAVGRA